MNIQSQLSSSFSLQISFPKSTHIISEHFCHTNTVKAILILSKTMLARPEFLLKQATHNALTTNFLALDSTAFAAHHV